MTDRSHASLPETASPWLLPLMVIATVAAVVISLVGIAIITGLLPRFDEPRSAVRVEPRPSPAASSALQPHGAGSLAAPARGNETSAVRR